MMSDTLRKRGRDSEAQPDSIDDREPKRFHGEETDRFLHLLQLDPTLAEDQEEEECAPSEELVNVVMKSNGGRDCRDLFHFLSPVQLGG